MKTLGIVAIADESGGGIFQYSLSLIEALAGDPSHRYVILAASARDAFSAYGLEVRHLAMPPMGPVAQALWRTVLITQARLPLPLPPATRVALADIDGFVLPGIFPFPALFTDRPYLFTFHDAQERHLPRFFPARERLRRRWIGRAMVTHARAILTESNAVKEDVIRFMGAPSERIRVLPAPPTQQFLNKSFAQGELDEVRQKYRLPERYLFYPAQFWPHKNHLRLLDAMALLADLPDIHLVLTGSPQSGYPAVIAKISELGLERRVHLLGFVDYDDLPALYRLSLALVLPTLFESISIP
ncbi:MAG: glycosyltransferase family 4 protein, partial [Cyanobacteria bacterium REEB65]|nr:glycosyltransferase family 4 protein [Cyanobacteria bacterium REEB65]